MTASHFHLLMIGAMSLIVGIVVEISGQLHRRKRRRQALDAGKASH